jgi:hypothetical protein
VGRPLLWFISECGLLKIKPGSLKPWVSALPLYEKKGERTTLVAAGIFNYERAVYSL